MVKRLLPIVAANVLGTLSVQSAEKPRVFDHAVRSIDVYIERDFRSRARRPKYIIKRPASVARFVRLVETAPVEKYRLMNDDMGTVIFVPGCTVNSLALNSSSPATLP